jgi:hypothetical protein
MKKKGLSHKFAQITAMGFAPMYVNRAFLVTFVKCFRAGLVWGK